MLDRKDLLALSFYEKSPFTGSNEGIRFRIEKGGAALAMAEGESGEKNDADGAEKGAGGPILRVYVWPEPLAFDKTPKEGIDSREFAFSEEGLEEITAYLNARRPGARWSR